MAATESKSDLSSQGSSWFRLLTRYTFYGLLSYLGVVLVMWFFEGMLVYRPCTAATDWKERPTQEIQDVELISAGGQKIHAWWLPCPGSKGAVLYCHGNAGNLSHRGAALAHWRAALNCGVMIIDYPGYGKSPGRPNETNCIQAADAAYDWLVSQAGADPEQILLYGGSLGGGVAVDLATRKPHRALVLAKTFTSLPDVANHLYPWLPARWFMSNRFDNLAKLPSCKKPVLIAHGRRDELVPFAHAERLMTAANEPKHLFVLGDTGHNDPLNGTFFQALTGFLEQAESPKK